MLRLASVRWGLQLCNLKGVSQLCDFSGNTVGQEASEWDGESETERCLCVKYAYMCVWRRKGGASTFAGRNPAHLQDGNQTPQAPNEPDFCFHPFWGHCIDLILTSLSPFPPNFKPRYKSVICIMLPCPPPSPPKVKEVVFLLYVVAVWWDLSE